MPKLDLRNVTRIKTSSGELSRLKVGSLIWTRPQIRPLIQPSENIGVDGHSFLAFPSGYMGDGGGSQKFPTSWNGAINLTYSGYSSLQQRWNMNGASRTANYNGALWVTEFADPSGGSWPAPDTSQGQTTLQYLYYWALLAQRKGCKAMFIFPPHSPEQLPIDANIISVHQYYLDWLKARPEITIPIYMMPNTQIVRSIRNYLSGQSIFTDGLHLANSASLDVVGAIGMGLKMMMTGAKPAYESGWNTTFRNMIDIVWNEIQAHQCTGFGGSTVITPWDGANPLEFPVKDEHSLFINNAATINGLNVSERTHNGFYATESGGRRCIAWQAALPVGTRIQCDITFSNGGSGGLWVRTANTADLGPTDTTQLANYGSAGTYSFDAVVSAGASGSNRTWFGFLTNTAGSSFRVSNFRVTYP